MVILNILIFFLVLLGFGTYLFTFLASTSLTGAGLFRVILSVPITCYTLSFFYFLNRFSGVNAWLAICLIVMVIFHLIEFKLHVDLKSKLMKVIFTLNVLIFALFGILFMDINLANIFYFFSSMSFVGLTTYLMILGHWYLVTPKLTEQPLKNGLILFWIFGFIKLSFSLFTAFENIGLFQEFSSIGAGYMFNWIALSMRFLWGYLILFILSYFTWRLVKIRSIQSATGILYVMVFFIWVGELISYYMFFNYGIML
jgi:hypothetical protein